MIVAYLAEHGYLLNPPSDTIRHQYPHCWRCKNPIVFRATPQWFIAMDHERAARRSALAEIDATTWIPPWGHDRIHAMIENRPDWCCRASGCGACRSRRSTARRAAPSTRTPTRWSTSRRSSTSEGADAWWTQAGRRARAAGHHVRQVRRGRRQARAARRTSSTCGSSRACRGSRWAPAATAPTTSDIDLYLEGCDQHRGWFHSSLLAGDRRAGHARRTRRSSRTASCSTSTARRTRRARSRRRRPRARRSSYIEPDGVIKKSGAEMFRLWVALDRVPQRHPVLADDPRRARRVVSQAPQHRAVPARQPARASIRTPRPHRSCNARRSIATCSRGSTTFVARARDAYERVRAPRRASPARRLRHRRPVGAATATSPRIGCTPTRSTRPRGAPRRSCSTSACARSRRSRRRSCASPPRTSGSTCRSAPAIPTACTSRRSRRRASRAPRRSRDFGDAARVARARQRRRSSRSAPRSDKSVDATAVARPSRATSVALLASATPTSSPTCSSCRRSSSRAGRRPGVDGRGRIRARAASAAGSTTTRSPPSRTTSASVAPPRSRRESPDDGRDRSHRAATADAKAQPRTDHEVADLRDRWRAVAGRRSGHEDLGARVAAALGHGCADGACAIPDDIMTGHCAGEPVDGDRRLLGLAAVDEPGLGVRPVLEQTGVRARRARRSSASAR